ncbi:unnamed protein product [Ambrosiozyma monospora]|uniref:Unnamed protein product n=1 Tax=Ambrosiozyma monospora TaxID=43982 RepID=A0ACB5TJP8_AMBMO|nr:unnamed protein product [Ambrosiozyma monospora]
MWNRLNPLYAAHTQLSKYSRRKAFDDLQLADDSSRSICSIAERKFQVFRYSGIQTHVRLVETQRLQQSSMMHCYCQSATVHGGTLAITVPVTNTPSLQSVYISKKLSSFSKSWKSSTSLSSSITSSSSSSISELSDTDSCSDADSESIFDHQHKKHQISSNTDSTSNDDHSHHSQHSQDSQYVDSITISSIICSSHEPVLDGNHPLAYSDEDEDDDEVDENEGSLIFTPSSSVTPSPIPRHQQSSFSRLTSKISKFFERTASALDRIPDPYVFYNANDTTNTTRTHNDIPVTEDNEVELTTFNEQDQNQTSLQESTTLPQFSTLNPFSLSYPISTQQDEEFPLIKQRQLRLNPAYLKIYAIDLSLREKGYLNVSDYELDLYTDYLLHNNNEHESNDDGYIDHDDTSCDSSDDELSTSTSISSSDFMLNSMVNPQTEADYDYQLQLRLSLISNHKLSQTKVL